MRARVCLKVSPSFSQRRVGCPADQLEFAGRAFGNKLCVCCVQVFAATGRATG